MSPVKATAVARLPYNALMVTKPRVSLAEYLAMEESKPYLELIDGDVVQKSMPGLKHSTMVVELITELRIYLRVSGEARVETELRHIERKAEWVFLPDISVTLKSRITGTPAETSGLVDVLPDFAIEVLSPDDQPGRITQRIAHYMGSGVSLLWVVDPEAERVTVWQPGQAPRDLAAPTILSAAPVLASFEVDLSALFARLHE